MGNDKVKDNMNIPILEICNLNKEYIKGEPIFTNFNMKLKKGEILAISGSNGAGKTTLLRIIAGLDQEYQGTVLYHKKLYQKPTSNIFLISQSYEQLLPWFTIKNNIKWILFMLHRYSLKEAENITRDVLENVGIEKILYDRYPYQLSGGQKKKVMLGRALALNAQILLLDEPFTALDNISTHNICNILMRLVKEDKKSLILVSHSSVDSPMLADRTIFI